MQHLNAQVIIALVIHMAVCAVFVAEPHYAPVMPVMAISALISLAGLLVCAGGSARAGAIIYIIGCIPFVPLGLIGVFGAKRILTANPKQSAPLVN